MNKQVSIIVVFLLFSISLYAQKAFVLWDKVNGVPVTRASVYATHQGKVKCAFSDQQGGVIVNFPFESLTVSHINYKTKCIKMLPDTLFLEQTIQNLPEIVVYSGEPTWIRPMLKNFIKTNKGKYSNQVMLRYNYQTENIGDTVLYRFESKGLVRKKGLFEINPMENTIVFKDKTAGCDYNNLKNTLYHDFVTDMDEKFVKEHKFYVDDEAKGLDANVVKVLFKSEKEWRDSGYICIDTLKNAILRAKRSTGLEYNVKDRTNAFVRTTINAFYRHKYTDWQIDVEAEYQQSGDFYFLKSCRYANYMQEEFDNKKRKGEYTYNVTSIYTAQPCQKDVVGEEGWMILPKPFSMKIIMSKKETRQEELLQQVNKEYHIY
jgi:hypothetical protein